MTPCPQVAISRCQVELQRVAPSESDPAEYRGLSGTQLGVARHLTVVHRFRPDAAAATARSWSK